MFNDIARFALTHGYALMTSILLVGFLLALSYIDMQRFQLPDRLTLPLLWIGLMLHAVFRPQHLANAVIGAPAGYLCLWAIYWLMKAVTKKEGLGYGDFKLMAALGAWLGWESLPFVAFIASVTGTIMYVLRFLFLRRLGAIPFGPFLAVTGGIIYISQQVYGLADTQCLYCVTIQ